MHLFMKNNNAFFIFFFLFAFSLFQPLFADVDSRITPPPDASAAQMSISSSSSLSNPSPPVASPPPPPISFPNYINPSSPFKPSVAVIIGVLTTMFSITLLLVLYAQHCKRAHIYNSFDGEGRAGGQTSEARKNSGIDRAVIESLPIFRFSSLRGQKDGLECAVCLARFEPSEVLRLLPKCKHAFHVECVDTWLDAHSTCPLCRYRVDPEDILLIDRDTATASNILFPHQHQQEDPKREANTETSTGGGGGGGPRISGRHSSAGEKASGFHDLTQIVVQRPSGGGGVSERVSTRVTSFARRSLDSISLKKNKNSSSNESVAVGCFDRYRESHQRKDGLLLLSNGDGDGDGDGDDDHSGGSRRTSTTGGAGVDKTRFEHRIIVSGSGSGHHHHHHHQRWSDVHPSDLLYLRSEMIISDSRRFPTTSGSRPSVGRRQRQNNAAAVAVAVAVAEEEGGGRSSNSENGRNVIKERSVSEITGLNRFSDRESNESRHHRERQAGVVSRWLAWISSQSPTAVRSFRTTTPSDAAV